MSVLVSLAHWIFATQYLEIVLLLPILLDHSQADLEKKQRRVKLIMNAVNAYFFVQLATWASFMLAYSRLKDIKSNKLVFSFDAANKLLPAILLIISILLFRFKFNSKVQQKVFAREKLVLVHLIIFVSFLIAFGSYIVLSIYSRHPPKGSVLYCRLFLSSWYFNMLKKSANIATLIFFVYMSAMFSRPLTGYWVEFLLSYRNQSLSQAIQARI